MLAVQVAGQKHVFYEILGADMRASVMARWQLETDLRPPSTGRSSHFDHPIVPLASGEIAALRLCYDGSIQLAPAGPLNLTLSRKRASIRELGW